MSWKKIVPLVIAVALGLVAAKMAMNLVGNKVAEPTNGPKSVSIVLANQNVAAGQELTSADVVVGQIATDAPPETTFKTAGDVVGRVTTAPLIKGQALLSSMLATKGSAAGLQALVPKDMRAFTIEMNEFSGVAGYLTPGCHVDIIQTMRDDDVNDTVSRTIAQNVLITAVGQRREIQPGQDPNVDPGLAHSVTLLVTPDQVEMLDLATKSGRPSLALRNAEDSKIYTVKGITLTELRGRIKPKLDENVMRVGLVPAMTPPPPPPSQSATTRPSAPVAEWDMEVISGPNHTVSRFPMPRVGVTNTNPDEQ
jgi:pilus assembly protein CpaB